MIEAIEEVGVCVTYKAARRRRITKQLLLAEILDLKQEASRVYL